MNASVELSEETLRQILKTDMDSMLEVYDAKIVQGSELAALIGHNAHHANIIAALFAATGQDLAHVVEGSHGSTRLEKKGDKLIFSVHIPALVCAVVGGGTHLAKQREALDILGLKVDNAQPGKANNKFAGIIGAAVLAGELSLMAALASRDLARAHEQARTQSLS